MSLQDAITAARAVEALIPLKKVVGLKATFPGSSKSAYDAYKAAAVAAWREAVMTHVSDQMTSSGGPVDFAKAKEIICQESDLRNLEAMTNFSEWMPLA